MDTLLLPPQIPEVETTKRVILYDHHSRPLVYRVGFKGTK